MEPKLFDTTFVGSTPQDALDFIVNVLQSATDYSLVGKGLDGTILLWNAGARRLYGYDAEEVLGKATSEVLFTPEDIAAGRPREIMRAALRDGKWEGLLTRVRKSGQRFFARSLLEPCGYKVITAGGMIEGLAAARQVPCDLIISDVCMSEGTGYEFIRAVRADPQLRDVPFVFITSTMLDEKDRAQGLALGAARFLMRPIEPEAFLAEIAGCLREHGKG